MKDKVDFNFDYKHSSALHELSDGKRLQLTNCRRSDRYLFDLLDPQNIKHLDQTMFGSNTNTYIHLSYTNAIRKNINEQMMNTNIHQSNINNHTHRHKHTTITYTYNTTK